ncbi:hypothetical protein D3C78_921640 [compost metagenome]
MYVCDMIRQTESLQRFLVVACGSPCKTEYLNNRGPLRTFKSCTKTTDIIRRDSTLLISWSCKWDCSFCTIHKIRDFNSIAYSEYIL